MTNRRLTSIGISCAFFALTLGGCDTEGPAEEAGERVDRGVERAGEAIEEAGDKAKEQTNQ